MGGGFDVAVVLGEFGWWHDVGGKRGGADVVLSWEMVGNWSGLRRGPYLFVHLGNHVASFKLGLYGQRVFVGRHGAILGSSFLTLLLDVARNLFSVVSQPHSRVGEVRLLTLPLRFFSRLYWHTYSSSADSGSVSGELDAATQQRGWVRTDAARARCLAVAPGSHAVAMVAGATHPALDRCRLPALQLGGFCGGVLHGGWDGARGEVVRAEMRVAITWGSV